MESYSQMLPDPQEQPSLSLIEHFNNSVTQFQSDYDEKKKKVLSGISFTQQDTKRLASKSFENDALQQKAKLRI